MFYFTILFSSVWNLSAMIGVKICSKIRGIDSSSFYYLFYDAAILQQDLLHVEIFSVDIMDLEELLDSIRANGSLEKLISSWINEMN